MMAQKTSPRDRRPGRVGLDPRSRDGRRRRGRQHHAERGTASVRLLSVTTQGPAVVIEATEPVAYTVNRPDPLTLIVDLRNAAVADAAARIEPKGVVTGIRLEQATRRRRSRRRPRAHRACTRHRIQGPEHPQHHPRRAGRRAAAHGCGACTGDHGGAPKSHGR